LGELLAVHPVSWAQGKQLEQALGLLQTPPVFPDGSGPYRDSKPAEQFDA
jgi:hypothetical protein